MPEDVLKFLDENREAIESAIKKYLPKKFSKRYLERTFGRPHYTYDSGAINQAIADPVWELLSRGGKRWRPALFLLVAEMFGKDPKKFIGFSVIPELVHQGSLIVDDVEDSGELRRGKPAIHRIFGQDIAINAGNFLYFLPTRVFIENRDKLDQPMLIKLYEIFCQEMINIHIGQAMDILWHKGKEEKISEEQYLQMCAYKTGTLVRMSAKLAAVLSGGSDEQAENIGRMAESIGVAFQIQDDILDVVSAGLERKKFGKSFGNDIKEGKRTLMVIHALRNAKESERKRLLEILNMHTKDSSLVEEAIGILNKNGSVEYAKKKAREMVSKTWEDIERTLPESNAKKKLRSFVNFLIEREF